MVNILNKVVHFHVNSFINFAYATGTVVKRKRGKLLADLAQPGDEILVARGGQGGVSHPFFFFQHLVSVVLNIEVDAFGYTDDLSFLIFHEISVLVID